jgi:hypothetical protein
MRSLARECSKPFLVTIYTALCVLLQTPNCQTAWMRSTSALRGDARTASLLRRSHRHLARTFACPGAIYVSFGHSFAGYENLQNFKLLPRGKIRPHPSVRQQYRQIPFLTAKHTFMTFAKTLPPQKQKMRFS